MTFNLGEITYNVHSSKGRNWTDFLYEAFGM